MVRAGTVKGGLAGCDLDCGFAGRRIFLSSKVFDGDMGTRAGADLACQVMAEDAGFRHSERYRALLADADGSPNTFVDSDPPDYSLPFILPTGLIVAASYPSLLKLGPGAGITTTEQGKVMYDQFVWTNVNPAGGAYLEDLKSTCAGWTSADKLLSARVGYNAVAPGDPVAFKEWQDKKQWLSFSSEFCLNAYRIYCIETY